MGGNATTVSLTEVFSNYDTKRREQWSLEACILVSALGIQVALWVSGITKCFCDSPYSCHVMSSVHPEHGVTWPL